MNVQSKMSYQPMLLGFDNATGSPASESGPMLCETQVGVMTEPCGLPVVLASLSAPPGSEKEPATNGTSGLHSSNSSMPADRQSYLGSRSRVVTSSDGHRVILITCGVCQTEKSCEEFRTHGSRRRFRGTCKDCQNEQERKRRLVNETRTSGQRKDWRRKNRASALVSSARCRARTAGLQFDLDTENIQTRIDAGRCELTGIHFDLDGDWNSPSLDRIDPNGGYTADNIRVIITALNVMMNKWGAGRVLVIADAMRQKTAIRQASENLTRSLQEKLKQTTDRLGSTLFRLTWKEQVTPSGRVLPLLRASALPISDTVFSSWPTPRANDAEKHGNVADGPCNGLVAAANLTSWPTPTANNYEIKDEEKLNQRRIACKERNGNGNGFGYTLAQAAMLTGWATPRSQEIDEIPEKRQERNARHLAVGKMKGIGTANLSTQVKLASWTTPAERDYKDTLGMATVGIDPDGSERSRLDQLPRQAQLTDSGETQSGFTADQSQDTPKEVIGQLDPAHPRWLMALPPEWCDCAVMAMESMQKSPKNS